MHHAKRTKWLKIGGGLTLAGACGVAGLMLFLDRWGQNNRAQKADVIVVLGASVRDGGVPSESLRGRALRAAALYEQRLAPKIITTGGVGDFPPAEAQVAARILEENGVPSRDILREETSTSTWENAIHAEAICRAHGWERVIIVSEPYHLWRAAGNFSKHGLTAYASPSPNRPLLLRLRMTLREVPLALRDIVLRRV
jgi:uncharacterized SAM-binding protein YcdF (DUF218 family)